MGSKKLISKILVLALLVNNLNISNVFAQESINDTIYLTSESEVFSNDVKNTIVERPYVTSISKTSISVGNFYRATIRLGGQARRGNSVYLIMNGQVYLANKSNDTQFSIEFETKNKDITVQMYSKDKEGNISDYVTINLTDNGNTIYNNGTTPSTNYDPVLNVNDIKVRQGETLDVLSGVSANDHEDGDITSKVKVIYNDVDVNTIGQYSVIYQVTDSDNNTVEDRVEVSVNEYTNLKPEIYGVDDLTIKQGEYFEVIDGVSAIDYEDGDITSKIKVEGDVDTSKVGDYKLNYSVQDSDNNETKVERIVTVRSNNIPTIKAEDIYMMAGYEFDILKGVTATDKEDGDITSKIQVIGEVNTSLAGVYQITYLVEDSDRNQAKVSINVTVQQTDWSSHWGKDNVRKAMELGWVNESTVFRPNDSINRAEFIKIVNRAFGYTEIGEESFSDVYKGLWYYDDVRIAVKAGYITTANTTFRPNDQISREEVAVIITNILNNKDAELDKINQFEDYKLISPWAQTSVEGAVEAGYMGVDVDMFYPISNITRAEAVTTLIRVANK